MNNTRIKRIFFIFVLVAAAVSNGSPLFGLDWGFKLGLNRVGYSLSKGNFPLEFESRSLFTGGVFSSFNLGERFSLQPELLVAKKGVNFFSLSGWKYQHDIYYLEIPLLLKCQIPFRGGSVPEIFFGPYYGKRLGSETINIFDNFEQYMIDHQDTLDDAVRGWDYGLVFGGSIEWDTCFATLVVDIRFSLGVANILKDPAAYNHKIRIAEGLGDGDFIKNRALVILFGLSF